MPLVDPEDNTNEQQQRAKPADNDVCAEHSEPVQEQNEINNPRQHEPDFGLGARAMRMVTAAIP